MHSFNKPHIFLFNVLVLLISVCHDAQAALTATQRQDILDAHNVARRDVNPPAKTMPNLAWDSALESVAQAYANKCVFAHNANKNSQYGNGKDYVGENIAAGSSSNVKSFVDLWVKEKSNYTYSTNGCSGTCGHYTQVVWANTTKIGCGYQGPSCTSYGYLLVCDYFPGGNYEGQKPYVNSSAAKGGLVTDNTEESSKV
jgi:uncharacterized protein YkwD